MSKNCFFILVIWAVAGAPTLSKAQGRVSIPNVTQQQAAALVQMDADLQPLTRALNSARAALAAAALAEPRNDGAIQAKVEAVKAAELALARARAEAFLKIQASPNRLAPDQVTAYGTMAGTGGGRGGRGGIPNLSPAQTRALAQIATAVQELSQHVAAARLALGTASVAEPRNGAGIQAKAEALGDAELALAKARADSFARLQGSPDKLAPEQVAALIAAGGTLGAGGGGSNFTQPEPLNFNDHEGYVSLFDGVSLKGWDGNPKFWRVEDGAIVGESTPQNPSGNTYLVYRGVEAHDFTLKFEIKIEGDGGSGLQYRSKTGVPWISPISLNVIANVGPVNLDWMMTGPQADFWPATDYSGQFYSENDPMRIMAWRGQVVEGAGAGRKRLMGMIGDHRALNDLVRKNDWNEYTVIARGGTFLHIMNGQLMAVMVDDDPNSINNQSGLFGIEIEATTKVSVRNIWLKKLN